MTYNILMGGYDREEAIYKVISQAKPNVIVFQEILDPNFITNLAKRLNLDHVCLCTGKNNKLKVGLLSEFPIINVINIELLSSCSLIARVQFQKNKTIPLYGVHLFPFHTWFCELIRNRQVRKLLRLIDSSNDSSCLLVGDFNAIAPNDQPAIFEWPLPVKAQLLFQGGFIIRKSIKYILDAGFVDCFRYFHPDGKGYTMSAKNPTTRLDYIFVKGDLINSIRRCEVVNVNKFAQIASDHLPVLVEFDI